MTKVTVYRFTVYDPTTDQLRESRRWGTLDGIKAVGGHALEHTRVEIDGASVGSEVPGLTSIAYEPTGSRSIAA